MTNFEIRGYILVSPKILIGLDSCSRSSFFNLLDPPFGTYQPLNRLTLIKKLQFIFL